MPKGSTSCSNASSAGAARRAALRLRPGRDRRSVAPRQRRQLVAARSAAMALAKDPKLDRVHRPRRGLRRRTLDGRAAIEEEVPADGADHGAVRAIPFAARPHVRREAAVGAARPVRRPCRTPALIRCVLVIFGASGDLTRRKLLPAIYNLAEVGPSARAVRDRRRGAAGESTRTPTAPQMREQRRTRGGRAARAGQVAAHRGAPPLHLRRVRRPGAVRATDSRRSPSIAAPLRRFRRTISSTWRSRRSSFATVAPPPRRRRARRRGRRLAPRHRREAVRLRPGERARAERANCSSGLPRIADLPDRSLPREGNRPEHPGVPVRQRHLRADLEPPLRRPRADDRRRRGRHRQRAARTTTRPARCATSCRTTCSSC